MIGCGAAGSPPGCSRRRCGCGSPAPSAGWSGGWSGGWWGGSLGRGRPPCGGLGREGFGGSGRVRTPLLALPLVCSRSCFLPDVVGHLLHVAPLVAAADDEPDEEQEEQQEEDGADDRAHDHAHFVGGCRGEGGGGEGADGLKAQGGRTSCSR